MNNSEKDSKVDDDAKNCKAPVPMPSKKFIQHSVHPRDKLHPPDTIDGSKLNNRSRGKTNLHIPIVMTKRLSRIAAEKIPQIHENRGKIHASKCCTAQLDNAGSKTVRDARSRMKHEKKHSKVLVPDEKSSALASRKQLSVLKSRKDDVIDVPNWNIFKKTSCKTNRTRSLSKTKEVYGKTIPSLVERVHLKGCREKEHGGKKEESSRSASKQSEKINRKQENYYTKKYCEKVNAKAKIEVNSKKIDDHITSDSKRIKESKKINPEKIIEVEKTLHKKTICNANGIDANIKDSGAARTRIFKRKRSSRIDKNSTDCKHGIHGREAEYSKKEFRTENPPAIETQNRDEKGDKTSDSTKHACEQSSINSAYDIKDNNIISLYSGGFTTPESSTDCNRYQEFKETFVKSVGEKPDVNSFATSSGTHCKKKLYRNTENDLSQENVRTFSNGTEACSDKNISGKDEKESITDSTMASDQDYDRIKKSQTVGEIPFVLRNEITYHTNLINYGYHSDHQYCQTSNKQQNMKCTANNAMKSTVVDESQGSVNDDARYKLIKAVIQPITEIHKFKAADNSIPKLLLAGHKSERVITRENEELQECFIHSSHNDPLNEKITNVSSSVKQSQDNANISDNCESRNPYTSAMNVKQPLSNTSDYIAMNLKMKSCKSTKKYRHFKHEENNMSCNMARYIKKMVSNEMKYQEVEKKENPEREEVRIIIDENSPKTSKISIVNDRSSVSVVCHSLGRTLSPIGRKNDPMASKAESSGGESSGYKSFHNNSDTKNFDMPDQIGIKSEEQHDMEDSAITTSHNPGSVHVQHYDPSVYCETSVEPFDDKATSRSSESAFIDNTANKYSSKIKGESNRHQNKYEERYEKQSTETEYSSYDTKNYLSTFTNHVDVYLPCEITAYQFEERNRSKIHLLNNDELVEKDVDNAELYIGKYLTDEDLGTRGESSEEEEGSSQKLDSAEDFAIANDQVVMLKKPDNLKRESVEFVVNERLLDPDNPRGRTNSTNIPAVRAQYRIVTSVLDIKPEEATESLETPTKASHVKFYVKNNGSSMNVRSYDDNINANHNITSSPVPQVGTKDTYNRSKSHGSTCLGSMKNEHRRPDDSSSNVVQELWTNKKSTVDSSDNDSRASERSCCSGSGLKKRDTNKFKFNIFRKSKSSTSEKAISIPLDQLPKPPASFLATSAPSESTISSSATNTDVSESDVSEKPHASVASMLRTNSFMKSGADTPPIHHVRQTKTDTVSDEKMNHSHFRMNDSDSIAHKDIETEPGSSITPLMNKKLIVKSQGLQSALPPPASALPPPYPFCCPFVPYMMQYWQNNHQPPPASTIPLPEADWKPTVGLAGGNPPPPGMVPIPWFPPMPHMNHLPTSDEMDDRKSNTLRVPPPPEWSIMPRGYAPCLPCSKTLESHLGKTDSSIYEDDELLTLETSESKQDGRKKKVSNKLFKIFRRKNRADTEPLDEDDKKGKYQQSRSDANKLNTVHVVQDNQENLDDRSIWDSPDIAGIVTPEEIGRCFRRGFRADGLTLSGDNYLCAKAPSDTSSEHEDIFNFSDHDTPLDFLLALGFSVDEATAAIRDDEVRSRFKAALTEARIWVPHIATTQGTLLYLLAMKAKPKVMRYFLQLVESIVNKRITNAVKLDAYLKILEKVEEGYVSFVTLFGKDTGKDDEEDTVIVEKQRRRILYTIYKYAESEAKEVDKPLSKASVDLLHSLAARYRPAIGPHLQLLACYIGEGLLTKDVQLEAAVIYLSRLDSGYIQLSDLEKYCGLPRSERRRAEQIART